MNRNSKAILIIISIILLVLLLMLCVYVQNGLRHIWVIDSDESQPIEMVTGTSMSTDDQNECSGSSEEVINENDEETSLQSSDSIANSTKSENSQNSMNSTNSTIDPKPEDDQSALNSVPVAGSGVVEDSNVQIESKPIVDSVPQEESSESLPIIEGENKENELPLVPIG